MNNIQETNSHEYTIISLFSGCGGMDLGLLGDFTFLGRHYPAHPFRLVYANDIDKYSCQTYRYNFSHPITEKDISLIDVDTLPKADIVVGGFPCQDFSLAGKREGLNSKRGNLYREMKRVIEAVCPKLFIAENVGGIKLPQKGDTHSPLDIIIRDMKEAGYRVSYRLLDASLYGVPQKRTRVFIIGERSDLQNHFMFPNPEENIITAKEAIDDLWDKIDKTTIPNHTKKDYSKAKFYPGQKTQGNSRIKEDEPTPTIRAEHHGNIEAHYRTFNPEDPEDMSNWRRLSVRECARLQSFPDEFVWPMVATHAYRQIGNAVPPVLAWHMGQSAILFLEGTE